MLFSHSIILSHRIRRLVFVFLVDLPLSLYIHRLNSSYYLIDGRMAHDKMKTETRKTISDWFNIEYTHTFINLPRVHRHSTIVAAMPPHQPTTTASSPVFWWKKKNKILAAGEQQYTTSGHERKPLTTKYYTPKAKTLPWSQVNVKFNNNAQCSDVNERW